MPRRLDIDVDELTRLLQQGVLSRDQYEFLRDVAELGSSKAADKYGLSRSQVWRRAKRLLDEVVNPALGRGPAPSVQKGLVSRLPSQKEFAAKEAEEEVEKAVKEIRERRREREELLSRVPPDERRDLNQAEKQLEELEGQAVVKAEAAREELKARLESDEQFIRMLLGRLEEPRRPILYQWIRSHAKWNELILGFGVEAFHLWLATRANNPDEALKIASMARENPVEASRDFAKFFTELLNLRRDAARVLELEEELKVLQVDYEFLSKLAEKLEKAYSMALASMCSSCKERFLMSLALRKVVEV